MTAKKVEPFGYYPFIAQELRQGRLVPFFGSAASSYNASKILSQDLALFPKLNTPPSAGQLAESLAALSNFPGDPSLRGDLAWVATWFENTISRSGLRNQLQDTFTASITPSPIHNLFATIAKCKPFLAVTTNYDDLFEHALDLAGCGYDVVVSAIDRDERKGSVLHRPCESDHFIAYDPKLLELRPNERTVVFKMHGSIDRNQPSQSSFVVSEEDYVDFLTRMSMDDMSIIPTCLMEYLRKGFLFLGYSLKDWNFRVLLRRLSSVSGAKFRDRPRHWAIMQSTALDQKKFWEWQGVSLHATDLADFHSGLERHWLTMPHI